MRGRDRPISYEKARTLLFQHLAQRIGRKVEFSSLDWHDGPIARNSDFSDDEFGSLWARAGHVLDQLIFAWLVPCWVEHDDQWKHADHDTLAERLSSGEEPNGLFVDRDDLETAASSTYPKELSGIGSTEVLTTSEGASTNSPAMKRRGRPPGGGHDDTPFLDDMAKLMDADATLSVTAASLMVADRAGGTDEVLNRAKRLERKFIRRRDKGR